MGHELEREEREHAVARLASYLRAEREEPWNDLAVQLLLAEIEEQVAPLYYNRGIADAQHVLADINERIEVNLDALKRLPPARRPGER
ncbi:MAG: DUF2164 family protein [Chloroflexi bacterium]|nr:DUF2164 family protein [Chloroflexota bacterium]MDA1239345.1 DUF2164 family protein [Chloroflexota bacterium]